MLPWKWCKHWITRCAKSVEHGTKTASVAALELQVLVTAASGTLVGCIDYLVSGSYAVSDRQADGSYTFTTGTSNTPVVISTGCGAPPALTVRVEVYIDYGASFSGTAYVAGYSAHYIAAPQFVVTTARALLSGPDGGVCAHEPPLFRLPAAASARPVVDTTAGTLTFSGAVTADQVIEASRPFRLRGARSGGFAAVVALSILSDPAATGQRQQLWRMVGAIATLALEADATGRGAAQLAYVGNATQFQVATAATLPIGSFFVIALVYDHSALTFELYQDGVLASADTAASDAVRQPFSDIAPFGIALCNSVGCTRVGCTLACQRCASVHCLSSGLHPVVL